MAVSFLCTWLGDPLNGEVNIVSDCLTTETMSERICRLLALLERVIG